MGMGLYLISHFTRHVIIYPCWDKSSILLMKWAPGLITRQVADHSFNYIFMRKKKYVLFSIWYRNDTQNDDEQNWLWNWLGIKNATRHFMNQRWSDLETHVYVSTSQVFKNIDAGFIIYETYRCKRHCDRLSQLCLHLTFYCVIATSKTLS